MNYQVSDTDSGEPLVNNWIVLIMNEIFAAGYWATNNWSYGTSRNKI